MLRWSNLGPARQSLDFLQEFPSSFAHQMFQNGPVKRMVSLKALSCDEIAKDLAQIGIRRCLVKVKGSGCGQSRSRIPWEGPYRDPLYSSFSSSPKLDHPLARDL